MVFSWGDGDFRKLGRGGSEGCDLPQNVERLNGFGVCHIECGAQFSLALTNSGQTWGKGDYYRLGHGTDQHVRKLTLVEGFRGEKVINVAVGALHCLAVTDTGMVFSWGEGDEGKLGHGNRQTLEKPRLIEALKSKRIREIACGSSHSTAITSSGELYTWGLGEYGRLGHGDMLTQLKPKLVKALLGHHIINVACGS
ncbi:uncharacterized protein LOC142320775 [Lycorma delicatula]|uniref:uncharacterized protein LOC142320775 n=1 Tax=Lycorma delicatula TaxID=130591 RepID=UPI003F514EA3